MLKTKSMKITVKVPYGITLSDDLLKKAQSAAQGVFDQIGSLYKTVSDLNKQGIMITLEELLSRRGAKAKKAPAKRKARRKKVARKAKAAAKPKVARAAAKPKAAKAAAKPKAARRKAKGKSKRTVLSAEQRKGVVEQLKGGATAGKVAAQFGVSPATVNNIKRAAGLTKPRKK